MLPVDPHEGSKVSDSAQAVSPVDAVTDSPEPSAGVARPDSWGEWLIRTHALFSARIARRWFRDYDRAMGFNGYREHGHHHPTVNFSFIPTPSRSLPQSQEYRHHFVIDSNESQALATVVGSTIRWTGEASLTMFGRVSEGEPCAAVALATHSPSPHRQNSFG